jgi:hypothetical protein
MTVYAASQSTLMMTCTMIDMGLDDTLITWRRRSADQAMD